MNKVGTEANAAEGRKLKQQDSNPTEAEVEPEKHLEESQKIMIKRTKEKERTIPLKN